MRSTAANASPRAKHREQAGCFPYGARTSLRSNVRSPSKSAHQSRPPVSEESLTLYNRQRTRPLNLPQLRSIARHLLQHELSLISYDLAVHFVAAPEMTRLNEAHLHHSGSTDVITFNYSEHLILGQASPSPRGEGRDEGELNPGARTATNATHPFIFGEIFICLDEALIQARRFRTTWQSEVVRYLVHGVLHLLGHDDLRPTARRRMKREESRLLRTISKRFNFRALAR
jgi:probable rRNA maturation factor